MWQSGRQMPRTRFEGIVTLLAPGRELLLIAVFAEQRIAFRRERMIDHRFGASLTQETVLVPVLVFERQVLFQQQLVNEQSEDQSLTLQSTPIGLRHESQLLAKLLS